MIKIIKFKKRKVLLGIVFFAIYFDIFWTAPLASPGKLLVISSNIACCLFLKYSCQV